PLARREQESAVRESRTRRVTRRELETWPGWNCAPTEQSKALGWKPSTYRARASSRPYPDGGCIDERGDNLCGTQAGHRCGGMERARPHSWGPRRLPGSCCVRAGRSEEHTSDLPA